MKIASIVGTRKLRRRGILTYSGGIQKESCIQDTRYVTLRENTELPETFAYDKNRLDGLDEEAVISRVPSYFSLPSQTLSTLTILTRGRGYSK